MTRQPPAGAPASDLGGLPEDRIARLTDILPAQAQTRPNAVAVDLQGVRISYGELEQRASRAAGALRRLGARPGDRVAWLGKNSEAWYELMFGAAKGRMCFTPINTRLAAPEIAFILQDCAADLLFVAPDFIGLARRALEQVERPVRVICVGKATEGYASYADLRDAGAPAELAPGRPTDDVLQLYTSGTTGRPKGVRLTAANYAAFLALRHGVEGFDYRPGEAVLIVMPLFHVAGANVSFAALAAGARLVLRADFDPADVLRVIEAERVAHLFLAPVMMNALLQAPRLATADLSSLRTVSYGGSPISEDVLAAAAERFGCGFIQFYGMTETCGGGATLPPGAHRHERLRSCGRAWAGLELRVAGRDGREAPPGEIGEIEIRGPLVMAGYWNRPDATVEALRPDGWLKTGDAGYMDAEGYVFVHDRVKDMIVTGGENVYPAEVENAIAGCPGVADVAVIGVPDETWGEAVKALVVPAPGEAPQAQAILAWARQRIAGYKVPKTVEFVERLPRNPSGKVLRRELREPYWRGRPRNVG